MSAQPVESTRSEADADGQDVGQVIDPGPALVEVRRNAAVSIVIGVAASAVAIAYLGRATDTQAVLDWTLCGVMGLIALSYFVGLLDARTPLLVADPHGVRIRLGHQWRGLPWEAIEEVSVTPRRGPLRDGRLVVSLHHLARALEGLDGRARRHAAVNHKLYGAPLAVPLGLTTRTGHQSDAEVADLIAGLSDGRTEVVTIVGETAPRETDIDEPGRSLRGGLGTAVSRVARGRSHDLDAPEPAILPAAPSQPVAVPLTGRRGRREVREELPAALLGAAVPADAMDGVSLRADLPEGGELRRAPDVWDDPTVRPISRLGEPVEPLVIDEFTTEPAYDPVIGPELAAARNRVGLSVDELADRTRIRPHVIESIEVDDFTPCGGDFYARGHIRTLARVLGKDVGPLLAQFDARYATAPINARRVFEAELATGMTGSMRSTVGGPNWGLFIGVVLSLVLVWGVVRLFGSGETPLEENPPPVLNGSAGVGDVYGEEPVVPVVDPLETTLVAVNAATRVQVADGDGTVVFDGDLVIGERLTLNVDPPVTVSGDNGGALTVLVDGQDMGFLGAPDTAATRTFQ